MSSSSAPPASVPGSLPAALLETVINRLAVLFLIGAHGEMAAAREAVRGLLLSHQPETEHELHLAAEVVSFSAHALEALSQAADPDLSLTRILRLRGSAVSLSREAHKSRRRLDKLQRDRRTAPTTQPAQASTPAQPAAPSFPAQASQPTAPAPAAQSRPAIDKAIALVEATRHKTPPIGHAWTQADQRREAARRITENLKKHPSHPSAAPQQPAPSTP